MPIYLTSFVGRKLVIGEIRQALDLSRLVTLMAPGGGGKTRLAVKVAEEFGRTLRDGAYMVDLSTVSDPTDVPHQTALALGLDSHRGPPLEAVIARLRHRDTLLLLDSCEHVKHAVVDLCQQVLVRCAGIRVLATSRERLGLAGETLFVVLALSVPPVAADLTIADMEQYEAVRLFLDRARSVQPRFMLDSDNVHLVANLCYRLDGIPLAIELAAARLRMLSLEETWELLNDRFRLLTGGPSGRQEALLATVDWSHRLLTESERKLFRRLSAFPSGFRFEAAVAVARDLDEDVLDLLGALVDKCFLQVATDPDGHTRYRMLESLREYGLLRLNEESEADMVQSSHFAHYLAMGEIIAAHQDAPDWDHWLDRLESDHDNFGAALAWGMRHNPPGIARLASTLGWFWQRRGHSGEGRRWIEAALAEEPEDSALKVDLLSWAAIFAAYESAWQEAARYADLALESARAVGHRLAEARALVALGNIAFYHEAGDQRRTLARRHYLEAYRLYTELGVLPGQVAVLLNLSMVEFADGDFEAGKEHAGTALAVSAERGWKHQQQAALGRLGMIALAEEKVELAGRFLRQAARFPNQRWAAANTLYLVLKGIGCVAAIQGRYLQCARLFGAAHSVAERDIVKPMLPREVEDFSGSCADSAKRALRPEAYEKAHRTGAELSEAEAINAALEEVGPEPVRSGPDRIHPLSKRELEVARLAANGLTNQDISGLLYISRRTVDSHLDHIRNKLGLHSRTQIVKWLFQEGEAAPT